MQSRISSLGLNGLAITRIALKLGEYEKREGWRREIGIG